MVVEYKLDRNVWQVTANVSDGNQTVEIVSNLHSPAELLADARS